MSLQASSSFRRATQRDDRRRRLLTDELSNPGDWPASDTWPNDAPSPQKSEHYGDAAFLDWQPRLLDLVPRSAIGVAVLLTAGAAIVAGLEASYVWMLARAANGGAVVTALDLAAKGSLCAGFSSLMLLAAAAMAMLVYSVRRHRTDDYQGRYRVWRWAALCWFFMAADQAASLREAFRDLMIALTGTSLVDDGALWWAMLFALVLGAVGSRLLMDMRSCRFSTTLLAFAAVAQALAVMERLGWILPRGGSREVMLLAGAEMIGNLTLLATMTLHARHVILDAQGLLPRREPQADDEPADTEPAADAAELPTADANRWTKVDPPHATPQPVFQRAAATPFSTSTAVASPVNRKLTKAERRALKERLLRERLERQRNSG